MKVSERLAAPAPPKPPAPLAYQRTPGGLERWMKKACADFTLAGRIEGLLTCSPEYLTRLCAADRGGYENLQRALADMVGRHVAIADGATELFDRIAAALAGGENSQ